jgi:peptide/nickel transport system substrate-binding protein
VDQPNGGSRIAAVDVSRRRFLAGLALGGSAIVFPGLLAACSADTADPGGSTSAGSSGGPGSSTAPAATSSGSAGSGAEQLIAGQLFEFTTFDPWFIGATNRLMHFQIYDPLVALSPEDGSYQPALASSWDLSDDGKSITLHLRDDVTFHNGKPFSAEDVLSNIERAKDASIGHVLNIGAARIASSKATDEHTVEITFNDPQPESVVLDFFAAMFIIQPDAMKDVQTAPAGTGPYKFDSFKPGQELVLTARDDYWMEGLPKTPKLVVKPFKDAAALALNLQGGSIDWVNGIDYNQVDTLQSAGLTVSIEEVLGAFWEFSINVKQPHLADKRVRQAIAYAVDREKIVKSVFFEHSKPTCTPFYNDKLPVYKEDDLHRYDFDLDKAAALLKDAGADGLKFEAAFQSSLPQAGSILEIVQADLAKIGVTVTIKAMPSTEASDYYNSRTYEIFSTASAIVPRDLSYVFSSVANFRADDKIITNWIDPTYQDLVSQAAGELDADKRTALYGQVRDLVMEEQPQVAIATRPNLYAFRKGVTGFKDNIGDFPVLAALEASS